MQSNILRLALCALCLTASGCVGMVIGTATDVAVEVGKVPFKVGGAVVDVVTGDEEEKNKEKESDDK